MLLPSGSGTLGARPCVFGKGGYDAADMAAHHGFDEDFVSKSRGVNAVLQASVVPTLRKVREGWGTQCVFDSSKAWATRPPASSVGSAAIPAIRIVRETPDLFQIMSYCRQSEHPYID